MKIEHRIWATELLLEKLWQTVVLGGQKSQTPFERAKPKNLKDIEAVVREIGEAQAYLQQLIEEKAMTK